LPKKRKFRRGDIVSYKSYHGTFVRYVPIPGYAHILVENKIRAVREDKISLIYTDTSGRAMRTAIVIMLSIVFVSGIINVIIP